MCVAYTREPDVYMCNLSFQTGNYHLIWFLFLFVILQQQQINSLWGRVNPIIFRMRMHTRVDPRMIQPVPAPVPPGSHPYGFLS